MHGLDAKTWLKVQELDLFARAEKAIADGRIGHLGFSFHDTVEVFQQIVDGYDKWTFCQFIYNFLDTEKQAGTRGLKYAAAKGLAIVVMEPIQGGKIARPPDPVRAIWEEACTSPDGFGPGTAMGVGSSRGGGRAERHEHDAAGGRERGLRRRRGHGSADRRGTGAAPPHPAGLRGTPGVNIVYFHNIQTHELFMHRKESTMPDKVRVGVVGTSWYADISHLARIKSHPRAELAAICGRDRSRAEEMAGKYGVPLVFTDYREMIEKGDLHALVVSVPDDLHYPMTMDALDAGLHVLCEKPLALNVEQAKAMVEKAEAAGVKHMVSFTNRWAPWYRYLKQLVDEGYTGRPFHCNIRYLAGYGRQDRYQWRFDRQRCDRDPGRPGLAHDRPGTLVRRRYRQGSARIWASTPTILGRKVRRSDPANDAVLLAVEFANGAHGTIQISAVALTGNRAMEQHIALHGQSGTLEVRLGFRRRGDDAGDTAGRRALPGAGRPG